jgi:hypothetical protein
LRGVVQMNPMRQRGLRLLERRGRVGERVRSARVHDVFIGRTGHGRPDHGVFRILWVELGERLADDLFVPPNARPRVAAKGGRFLRGDVNAPHARQMLNGDAERTGNVWRYHDRLRALLGAGQQDHRARQAEDQTTQKVRFHRTLSFFSFHRSATKPVAMKHVTVSDPSNSCLLIRLFQQATRYSVHGWPVRPFPRTCANFSVSSRPRRPANSIWPRVAGQRGSAVRDVATIEPTRC